MNSKLIYGIQQVGVGVENAKEAFKWYSKSAEQGHAEAQTNLGDFYLLGLGQLRAHKT